MRIFLCHIARFIKFFLFSPLLEYPWYIVKHGFLNFKILRNKKKDFFAKKIFSEKKTSIQTKHYIKYRISLLYISRINSIVFDLL